MTGTMSNRMYIIRLRNRLLKQFGNVCQCGCNSQERLEFAHKDHSQGDVHGRGRGQMRRMLDVKNHSELYLLMTHDCHQQYDLLHEQLDVQNLSKYEHEQLQCNREFEQESHSNIYPPEYFKI